MAIDCAEDHLIEWFVSNQLLQLSPEIFTYVVCALLLFNAFAPCWTPVSQDRHNAGVTITNDGHISYACISICMGNIFNYPK